MLKINEVNRLYLGIQGENNARTIEIDMNEWVVSYPNATVSIWHKRNGDVVPTPTGAAYDPETGVISWTPTNTDTYVSGEGLAEVRMTENGVIKKTGKIITGVSQSVTGAGTPLGSDWQSYIDLIESYKDAAEEAQEAAEEAAEEAEGYIEDAEAWATGKRGGVDVESTDPTYHNNSKYYSGLSAGSATDAATAKTGAETAQGKAEDAQTAAETAQGKAEDAQEAAEEAQGKAEAAVAHGPYVDDTTGNWMVWDADNEEYVDTEVHAKGDTGNTGAVPNISVGNVSTLQPDQPATVTRRSGSPDTAPIFDFGIPKGETGSVGTIYATNIPMSSVDETTIADAIGAKLNADEKGAASGVAELDSSGKVPTGQLPYSAFTGADGSNAGTSGLVPAPAATDNTKYLKGNGTWTAVSELPAVTISDNGKVPMVSGGVWTTEQINAFTRQFWTSNNAMSIPLDAGKTYLAWTAAASAGTTGAMMDTTSGCVVIVSNGKYGIIHKGSGITIAESSGNLVITSSSNIAMGMIEM